ncbi:YifB family Mg chelatase-like AAA ATPase [Candidatus Omnitrophota bacterium]
MLAKVSSSTVIGIEAIDVTVEVDVSGGLPGFAMVGLPDPAVKESINRVKAAIRNCGFEFPPRKITVNLAPADIRKQGPSFDLPIAIGILIASGQITPECVQDKVICGELSLDGKLRPITGALARALVLRSNRMRTLILPEDNGKEAAIVREINVYPLNNLAQTISFLRNEINISPQRANVRKIWKDKEHYRLDLSDVKGQLHVKRGLEIAACGGHNVLMIGPPGAGKTMLAKCLPSILPKMNLHEALETTRIHSVCGLLPKNRGILSTRPFRSPHHTTSDMFLV